MTSTLVVARETEILVRKSISAQDLIAVATGQALALRIDGYYSRDACETLAGRLAAADQWTTYSEESGAGGIGTLGNSLFGCMGQEICPSYFDEGRLMHRAIRRIVHPYLLPADRVQLELDHAWPHGASLLHIGTRPAFFGLVRMFREGGAALAHTDRADWDYPSVETATLKAQLFLNVYLDKTEAGGNVRLWRKQVERHEYDACRLEPDHYALNPALIPPHDIEVDVPVGSLLIANAWRIHEVTECEGVGRRLSVSGFVGYAGMDRPLTLFS